MLLRGLVLSQVLLSASAAESVTDFLPLLHGSVRALARLTPVSPHKQRARHSLPPSLPSNPSFPSLPARPSFTLAQKLLTDVIQSTDFWVVPIFDEDVHNGENNLLMARTLASVAANSDGLLRVGLVRGSGSVEGADGEERSVMKLYNVTHVPHLLVWPAGTGPRSMQPPLRFPPDVTAQLLSASTKRLWENLRPLIPSLVDGPLKTASLNNFLAAPPAALPRVVLVHAKPDASVLLKRLSIDFAARGVFALAAATDANVTAAWGLPEGGGDAPALFVSPSGATAAAPVANKKKGGAAAVPAPGSLSTWTRFPASSALTYSAIRAWLATTLPAAPTPQLRTAGDWERECAASQGLCVIGVFPAGERGAEPRRVFSKIAGAPSWTKADLESLQAQGGYRAHRAALAFMWVDGDAQGAWAAALRASAPALVVINPRKKLFATMMESFSEANVQAFVESVIFERPRWIAANVAAESGALPRVDVRLERVDGDFPALATQPKGDL